MRFLIGPGQLDAEQLTGLEIAIDNELNAAAGHSTNVTASAVM